ncbi:3-deoxy-manno-octulosonate cytidylyltransferase [Curvibacter sp. APW13]|uniref:3-deoxy-manno-octulosonate cytidylyltransferase n=1 Tax=Curvibacter sp. APW13 TaxID=3077236 RepID=UPI0028DDFE0C|nr:3-deoxy-manno-octulosonate cytidylyltransferase [Curvibacter sp. APW13]MDT8992092.1 3-deoxy-manno-octulosonate cytidylyltransferase [Curvibacter sp. APW13]
MSYTVLIPARLASTRLPNKPLADICGLPMVVRVARRLAPLAEQGIRTVVVADSSSIIEACRQFGVEVILTREDHPSGTDRLAEACDLLGLPAEEVVVNVQGDEPLIPPELVAGVAHLLVDSPQVSMATAAHALSGPGELTNPNVVKVVLNHCAEALYFSRAPIPWWRDGYAMGVEAFPAQGAPLRHIGIYAYRAGFLRQYPTLPPSPLEQIEALEQLRALWNGYRILVHTTTQAPGPGVDTLEDLERVRALISSMEKPGRQ